MGRIDRVSVEVGSEREEVVACGEEVGVVGGARAWWHVVRFRYIVVRCLGRWPGNAELGVLGIVLLLWWSERGGRRTMCVSG